MKNIIVNILILVMMFNIIMLIFPEGKTQKFCRLIIKIFIIVYIINNIFFNGSIVFEDLLQDVPVSSYSYQREINIENVDKEFIDKINNNTFDGEEVIKDITLNFTEDMDIKAVITLNKFLNIEESSQFKKVIAEIFNINTENIEID
ncbi:hypothetical protein [Sedimentibacter sp. MB31-C6]|uniref:hypothetical protein n=1 Tax=Sedimentibacter sp. MB31-C6 TaxID=3109366 RepID=UPI002DDCC60F|nr:hypothetical protein [Sedimentibacter sp. MB36-C1]WSI04184.1 hypothetical protein U8307_14460 [Sedimentibacter sp. MB36-C1]WSI05635.1 hypothetical protein U8307_14560 [Sedimentibacter sp. MB36-C1]